jgi:small-conductance mechanosensitive channel
MVDTIGLLSTKLRTLNEGMAIAMPNSTLVKDSIRNLSRSKKIMGYIFGKFNRTLGLSEKALVREIAQNKFIQVSGIDTGNIKIVIDNQPDRNEAILRISVLIFGYSDKINQVRQLILEETYQEIIRDLAQQGLTCIDDEEMRVWFESPMMMSTESLGSQNLDV